jgi:peptidoglycan/LPS O-acetylase OafA/YrhL
MTEPHSSQPQNHEAFPALDGLRALAVTGVVVTHAAYWTGHYEHGVGSSVLARLDIGVAVFFVLSGFLLARPWLTAAASGAPGPSVVVYSWRRVMRILPAYYLTVILAFVLLPENDDITSADWLRHLGLLQIYHLGWEREGLTQTWSLCTEAAFYLLLPFLGWVALAWSRRRGWSPRVLVGACAVLAVEPVGWYAWAHHHGWSAFTSANLWLPGYLGWFAGGMALAVVRVHLDVRHPDAWSRWWYAEELGRHAGWCWAMSAAAFLLVITPLGGPRAVGLPTAGQLGTKSTLYLVVTLLLVLPAVFGRSPVTMAVFANPLVRWYGRISYSVFLLHLTVLVEAHRLLGNGLFRGSTFQLAVLTFGGTLPLAALCYRLVEQPLMSLRRPPGRRWRPAPTTALVERSDEPLPVVGSIATSQTQSPPLPGQ